MGVSLIFSLPPMAAEFQASLTQIEWVVLAYMIAFAISIPLTSSAAILLSLWPALKVPRTMRRHSEAIEPMIE